MQPKLYSDVNRFEAIQSVIQLKQAAEVSIARKLVTDYKASSGIVERLRNDFSPVIGLNRTDAPGDKHALLLIGGYGTGKSHLMGVIAAVAEDASMLDSVSSDDLRDELQEVAGQFKAIRVELGSVTHSLRDIFLQGDALLPELEKLGVKVELDLHKPHASNRPHFDRIMDAFHQVYPEQGLLVIVDELLDYLRGRDNTQLTQDFGFIRELAEYTQASRFRLICGVQEAVVGNVRFAHVAQEAQRIMARMHSLNIRREDIEYVIEERLLRKTPEQKEMVRKQLEPFRHLYTGLASQFEKFVSLYPIHPQYIERFSKLQVGERREILTTLSEQLFRLQNQPIPTNEPGVVSFDQYWELLEENSKYDTDVNIREVKKPLQILKEKVNTLPVAFQSTARRILNGLALHRLTTPNLNDQIGMNVAELRDDLLLGTQNPNKNKQQLLDGAIATILNMLLKAVNHQYISSVKLQNMESYYLDLNKTEAVDENIDEEAKNVSQTELEQAYFDLFKRVLQVESKTPHVTGYNIWQMELDWPSRNTDRRGYVFFGNKEDRSTAQPEREFYVYICPPDQKPGASTTPDEVYFVLQLDDALIRHLKRYKAAQLISSQKAAHKELYKAYHDRSNQALADAYRHIQGLTSDAFQVVYHNTYYQVNLFCKKFSLSNAFDTLQDMIRSVASAALDAQFSELHPHYPTFSQLSPMAQHPELVRKAIEVLTKGKDDSQGKRLLKALEQLTPSDQVSSTPGRYAERFLEVLGTKTEGQVVNRNEVIEVTTATQKGEEERDRFFHMEPPLVAGTLAVLIHQGKLRVKTKTKMVSAANLETVSVQELMEFEHFSKDTSSNNQFLQDLAQLFDLEPVMALNPDKHKEFLIQLLERAQRLQDTTVKTLPTLNQPFRYWNDQVLSDDKIAGIRKQLEHLRDVMDRILRIDTEGKLRTAQFPDNQLGQARAYKKILQDVQELNNQLLASQPLTTLLQDVMFNITHVPTDLKESIRETRNRHTQQLQEHAGIPKVTSSMTSDLLNLKKKYVQWYISEYQKHHLSPEQATLKQQILQSSEVQKLSNLKVLKVVSSADFQDLQNELMDLQVGHPPTEQQMEGSRYQNWNPPHESTEEPGLRLIILQQAFTGLLNRWIDQISENLEDPSVAKNLELLPPADRSHIDKFRSNPQAHITPPVIKSLIRAFDKLHKIAIKKEDLLKALAEGGAADKTELISRLTTYLNQQMGALNPSEVRLVLE